MPLKCFFFTFPDDVLYFQSVAPGSVVFRGVRADDPDNGRGGTVTYSLVVRQHAATTSTSSTLTTITFKAATTSANTTAATSITLPFYYYYYNYY